MDKAELSRLSPAELIDLALQLQVNVEDLENRVAQLESQLVETLPPLDIGSLPGTESGTSPDSSPRVVRHHRSRHRHPLRFFFHLQRVTGLPVALILALLLLSVLLAIYIVISESGNSTQSTPSGFELQDRVAAGLLEVRESDLSATANVFPNAGLYRVGSRLVEKHYGWGRMYDDAGQDGVGRDCESKRNANSERERSLFLGAISVSHFTPCGKSACVYELA